MIPDITEHVYAICRALGKDPKVVAALHITSDSVVVEAFTEPKQADANGQPMTEFGFERWR